MPNRDGRVRAVSVIDKRDFDVNRPLLQGLDNQAERGPSHSRPESRDDGDGGDGLLSDVVDGIVERDRRKMEREVVRVCSFVWGVITW